MSVDLAALRMRATTELAEVLGEAVELRHRIHQNPRVGGDEAATVSELTALLMPRTSERNLREIGGGLLVRLGGAGPAIAIRAELDALPIQESSTVAWASQRPGVAHLCGHDTHTAALLATIRVIEAIGSPVPLIAIFQPREEVIPAGALDMLPSLAGEKIHAIIGVHVQPILPQGTVASAPGPINAAASNFDITVGGRPAHGAYPHLGRDPILAAAAIVMALQQLVSRRIDPTHPSVVTVGSIAGGTSHNAIPERVTIQGTLRSFFEADQEFLHAEVRRIAQAVASAYACEADVTVEPGEPVLRNDPHLAALVSEALISDGLLPAPALASCGADDFSYYGEKYPSLMLFAGVGDGSPEAAGLHNPHFVPRDETVGELARIMLLSYFAIAEELLA